MAKTAVWLKHSVSLMKWLAKLIQAGSAVAIAIQLLLAIISQWPQA